MPIIQPISLKIISLNIEGDRHFDRIIPFIQRQQPDVILLQEVLDKDIPYLEKAFKMNSTFTPLKFLLRDKDVLNLRLGILTLSNLALQKSYHAYYRGNPENLPHLPPDNAEKMPRAILVTEYLKDNYLYCFVNTHFTWTPDGQPSERQFTDLPILLKFLSEIPEFILCGDFNAPRGGIIFNTIASKYKDNIPLEICTTIDKNLHKAGDLRLVVDGLFTTPYYEASSIQIIDNLSDHCAILASIQIKNH